MLNTRFLVAISVVLFGAHLLTPTVIAESTCGAKAHPSSGFDITTVAAGCDSHSASQSIGGSGGSYGSQSGGTTERVCANRSGEVVDCWRGEQWWSPTYDAYCEQIAASETLPSFHMDSRGDPIGSFFRCFRFAMAWPLIVWENAPAPATPTSERIEAQLRTAVDGLTLHLPSFGIGAFVYPGYEEWGLSWWVGAPMWLWVNARDDRVWGEHALEVSLDGAGVTAKVRADKAVYDPGDGSPEVVCGNAGWSRPFSREELMRNHSPSMCEHVYMHTNTLGDVNSRYTVSATVTWKVTWSATTGQSGSFTVDVVSAETKSVHVGEIYIVNRVPPR